MIMHENQTPYRIMIDGIGLNVPIIKKRFPYHPVQGYVTGSGGVEWSNQQFAEFPRKMRTCQSQILQENLDSNAREIDVQYLAATPDMVPEFLDSRTDKKTMQVYSDLEGVPDIVRECEKAQTALTFRWRLAWYWQRPGFPKPDQVLKELYTLTGVALPPSTLWACQYVNYPYWDQNIVYGPPDFDR